jgi:hypothetical protein
MVNPFFAALTLLGLALPILSMKTAVAERRLYWSGALLATVSAFFVLNPPDWRGGLAFASAIAAVTVLRAYMSTSHIRIRGRTYAFGLNESQGDGEARPTATNLDDTAYQGFATAAKMWWLFVVVIGACSAIVAMFVVSSDGVWYAAGAVIAALVLPLFVGHQDASWGYRVARGQVAQLIIAGIVTLGSFVILYLAAYVAGSRWPVRSKRSPEYRPFIAREDSAG